MILTVFQGGDVRRVSVETGTRLIDALDSVSAPCGGNGRCGKCRVRASGGLSPAPDADGTCLACQTRIVGDASVWPSEAKTLEDIEVGGTMPEFELSPAPGRFGLAVDIGTTTVAARLASLTDGRIVATVGGENPQRAVAHDVIGRTQAALEGRGELLQRMINAEIDRLEAALCARASIDPSLISARVVTGNTTMLYLLTGRSPRSLASAPFEADCLFGLEESGRYFPPCFGAYVGADIACAVLASGMTRRHRTALLVDIGTNGEIALWHDGRLDCCATAAGSAFEGAGISCGVSSVRGAIESVHAEDGKLVCATIGGAPAVGVCGSGLIDAVAALLELDLLDDTGYLEDESVELAPGVVLTQRDIRQLQLAKGSICAGICALLADSGLDVGDVEALYIAGGFGRHINLASALSIGLIPDFDPARIRVIGNAALTGATLLLLSLPLRDECLSLASSARCHNLAQSAAFQTFYPDCMLFCGLRPRAFAAALE